MNYKDRMRKHSDKVFARRVNSILYYEVWQNEEGMVFFDNWTLHWQNEPDNDRDMYHFKRELSAFIDECCEVHVESTLYRVKTAISAPYINLVMLKYHEAKKHGNINVYRLD